MATPNPAHDRYHIVERYRRQARAVQRVAELNGAGYRAYLVVFRRLVVVHVSEGKRPDLSALPKAGTKNSERRLER